MASRWFTLALLLTPTLALENDFSLYPKGAQACLKKNAADASCTGNDSKEMNYCLCGLGNYNNDFILGSAACVGKESPNDIDGTYDMMKTSCSESQTPMKTTKKEFQQAAHDGVSTTSASGTATASATESASQSSDTAAASTTDAADDESTGLTTGATIGVAVGAAAGGAAVVGLFIWFWLHRRKKNAEESHPMLPNYETQNSPYAPSEAKPSGWQTPDPNAGGYYTPQYKPNAGPVELPPDNAVAAPAPIFEMDGTSSAAVEMPGSTPVDAYARDGFSRDGLHSSAGDSAMVSPQTAPGTPYRPNGEMLR
ncbi:uncharacterized protein FIESC28_02825 [Fusarium coffeatum]|uniref:Extracellular membrane protein CFEM domain-containing protein n=1 Tax=Fusarium coffeatum TaxID=231269 RepID=A0A366S6R0_9HYPO|nr:uncharacterized protein FIESC28_02825 [Fusarium coffeatum]RBR24335.1 hypothetical protein FIESC28_02825 [Fusarium coffeatum]